MITVDRKGIWLLGLLMGGLMMFQVAWVQASAARRTALFDEVDVQRINVREPDGTLRMVISNSGAGPGVLLKGKDHPHPDRKTAGIFFMNDEGTENGALIFDGGRKDGKVYGHGHLSFDQYEQDQVISLEQGEDNGVRHAELTFNDRPDAPLPWDLLLERYKTQEGQAEIRKLQQSQGFGVQRVALGKTEQRDAVLELKDDQGRARLVLKVAPDGAATIEFLDEIGKVVRTLTPKS